MSQNLHISTGDSPIYFLHIPKTAGTSFTAILDEQFPPEQVCPARWWSDLLQIPRAEWGRYRLFHGHMHYYLVAHLPKKPIVLTFLRDPVEHMISHYHHIRRYPEHHLYSTVSKQTLGEFVFDLETRPMAENFQARWLALDLNPFDIATKLTADEIKHQVLERVLDSVLPAMPDAELLMRAKKRLDEIEFVGLAEHFQESMAMLSQRFGWHITEPDRCLNVTPSRMNRTDISPETLELIHNCTRVDSELYAYAQQRFERDRLMLMLIPMMRET